MAIIVQVQRKVYREVQAAEGRTIHPLQIMEGLEIHHLEAHRKEILVAVAVAVRSGRKAVAVAVLAAQAVIQTNQPLPLEVVA